MDNYPQLTGKFVAWHIYKVENFGYKYPIGNCGELSHTYPYINIKNEGIER